MSNPGHEIAILNLSKRLKPEDVLTMVDAVSRQQAEDVCPAWGIAHRPLNVYTDVSKLPPLTTDVVPIVDEPGDPGVLGFHSMGIAPFGRVFVNPILDDGGGVVLFDPKDPQRISVSSCLSHEAGIELPVDPGCDQYALDADKNEWDLEPGDPVQRNQYVKIARMPWGDVQVAVSDFAMPAFYAVGSEGPWNYCFDKFPLRGPFTIAPGGYAMKNGQPVFARLADGAARALPPAWLMACRPPGSRGGRLYRRKLFQAP